MITWMVYRNAFVRRSAEDKRSLTALVESVRDKFHVRLVWFDKGDDVIATGKFEKFPDPETGVEREEFRADTLTPNPVSGRITINREPRNATVERDAAGVDRNQAFERPDQSPQAREPAVLGS